MLIAIACILIAMQNDVAAIRFGVKPESHRPAGERFFLTALIIIAALGIAWDLRIIH